MQHVNDQTNPHNVTVEQLGLDNVDNTADKDKPISDATQKALDGKEPVFSKIQHLIKLLEILLVLCARVMIIV